MAVFVYLEKLTPDGTVATNIHLGGGNFALSFDETGRLKATVRSGDGDLRSVTSDTPLPLATWRHVVMTADDAQLRLCESGKLVGSKSLSTMARDDQSAIWFGTNANMAGMWDGRIDEVAFFDRVLHPMDVTALYQAALSQVSASE